MTSRGAALAALSLVFLVLVGALLIYGRVFVTSRFEGRLWALPSQVFADAWTLTPGDAIEVRELVERLDRSGYARGAGPVDHPGQYRVAAGEVAVYARGFSTPWLTVPARRVRLVVADGRLASLSDFRGAMLGRLVLEPELLATLYGERHEERSPIRLDEAPEHLVNAVLAAEDIRFREHHGVDWRGMLRASWINLRRGELAQGGSTITQQAVKNLFLDSRRTWWRKLREIPLALILDASYSKDRILETYLNEVYLGQRGAVAICGVRSAARFYFGRELRDLTIGEAALLAGLIRNPGAHNPFRHQESALRRRDAVLHAMERLGYLDSSQSEAARGESLRLGSGASGFSHAPYAIDYVRRVLDQHFSEQVLEQQGLRIYTTIETRLQERAQRELRQGLERLERDRPQLRQQRATRRLEGAVVVLRPAQGAILALVGGREYAASQFNRAVQARRQPGSCFKPFVYAAAFEAARKGAQGGLTAASLLADEPLAIRSGGRTWQPQNYDRSHRGSVTVRRAIEESLNVPTVRAAREVGLTEVARTARACGIDSPLPLLPALALGAAETSPLELASAYATLAQFGMRISPWLVRAVVDAEGRDLGGQSPERTRAISPQSAFLLTDLLHGVVEKGTARSAARWGYVGPAAGKTGTTDDTRDAWFVGYDGVRLGLVWVGFDDNTPTGLVGASGALPIWARLMRRSDAPPGWPEVEEPAGMVRRWIDPESGALAAEACPRVERELFAEGSEPQRVCPLHGWSAGRGFVGAVRFPGSGAP